MTTNTRARPRNTTAPRAQTQAPSVEQSAQIAELTRRLDEMAAENARLRGVAPVTSNSEVLDASRIDVGNGDGDVTMPATGSPMLMRPSIEIPTDKVIDLDWAEEMKFMEDLLVVEVLQSDEQFPMPCISVWNGGRHQLFVKGEKQTVRRKFVEVLARRKTTKYSNIEYLDPEGNHTVKWPRRSSLAYPFVVHQDPNPRGKDWLKRILQEP